MDRIARTMKVERMNDAAVREPAAVGVLAVRVGRAPADAHSRQRVAG